VVERAGLVAHAVVRWMYTASMPRRASSMTLALRELARVVGAVVEHLDLEAVAGVVDARDVSSSARARRAR
jgi:hypothetical protein